MNEHVTSSIITPICSVLGHVDVGKTKLLDYLRSTHTKEVSGITQQIGTTVFDKDSLQKLCGKLGAELEVDRLIMIDTPGHSNFTTMRQVGAVISNLVIVVVDINKGLEEETKRCLRFVKDNHDTNFVIALNKLDRIYGWKSIDNAPLKKTFNKNKEVMDTVKGNIDRIICQLAELEINACAYYDNKDLSTFVSMIPLSAQTGEGIPDLILVISKMMVRATKKLEEKPISRYTFGYFLDKRYEERTGNFNVSININKEIATGDRLIIVDRDDKNIQYESVVRSLVSSAEGKEMKDKSRYKTIQSVDGTSGLGIFLNDDITPSPGSMYAVTTGLASEEQEELIRLMKDNMSCTSSNLMCQYDKKTYGVFLYAPSLNILSALISIVNENSIPIMDHCVGRLTRQTIIKINGVYERMDVEHEINYVQRYKTILVFNPVAEKENPLDGIEANVIGMCNQNKITLIGEKTVFKIMEKYKEYVENCNTKFYNKYKNIGDSFQLKILPEYVFMKTTPLLFGIRVIKGQFKVGTLVVAVKGDKQLLLGNITSIQKNKKNVDNMKIGDEICIRIESSGDKLTFGEDFDETYEIQRYITEEEKVVMRFIESLSSI
jgi:translation initiation factor 5B